MPELPEVQAHAERLTGALAGATLERFRPLAFTVQKTVAPDPAAVHGEALDGVDRVGKLLVLRFASAAFVVHLMQGGRLRLLDAGAKAPRSAQAEWRLTDGRGLALTEAGTERRAGVWVVVGDVRTQPPLGVLGPDAATIDPATMAAALAGERSRLHGFLRDQHRIAGLGRRLANEVCHRARLSPFATTTALDADQVAALVAAVHDAIEEGLAAERVRSDMSSSKDRPGQVHHRTGETCPVCGDVVREVAYTTHTIHYCATCQTGGKVLADNTTSRFLK